MHFRPAQFCALLPIFAAALAMSAASVTAQVAPGSDGVDWAKEQKFWSFQRPRRPGTPSVKNLLWPRMPLDTYVLARLEKKGLAPSPEADRRTLIRRVTFDLIGLPPTPQEVEEFVQDRQPAAYDRVVDRLLSSPRFGERMASMWLPLARYAEDQAHQVGDDTKFFYPNAYRYRDWVIGAFNRDLPYDQFVKLQLAADRYLNAKPTGAKEVVEESLPEAKPEARQSAPVAPVQTDLAALGFLGLGPKYYDRESLAVMSDEWEDRVDTVSRAFLGLTVSCARCHDHKFDPITTKDYYALAGVFASTKMINRLPDGQAEKGGTQAKQMNAGTLHVVEDGAPTDLPVFLRGNVENKGPVVRRRFLRVLCESEPEPFKDGSGRRELAEAIASAKNPLTARVFVNRVWGLMFGKPIVLSASNFGHNGMRPANPELLDYLAVRFMEQGWSVKTLMREIALSATYRQSSAAIQNPKSKIQNQDNSLLWRMNRRRLTVEQWRDAVLYVTGELKWDGPNSTDLDDVNNLRRTVCARISRLRLNDMLAQFDYPDANVHSEKRSVTTTPTQKLFMLNSPFMLARAKALAARLTAKPQEDDSARVQNAYRLLFARSPELNELRLALGFLKKLPINGMTRWEEYAQVLLASNEMLFVD